MYLLYYTRFTKAVTYMTFPIASCRNLYAHNPCQVTLGVCVYAHACLCAYVCTCVGHNALPAKLLMLYYQSFQPDRELDITTPHHILNLKFHEFGLHKFIRTQMTSISAHTNFVTIINTSVTNWKSYIFCITLAYLRAANLDKSSLHNKEIKYAINK